MGKIFQLVMANIRKNKSQSVSFFLFITISSLFFNLGLITWLEYEKNFDRKAEELASPDAVLVAQTNEPTITQELKQLLLEDNRTQQAEIRPALVMGSDFFYADGIQTRRAIIWNKAEEVKLGKIAIVEESSQPMEHPIYLPYLFKVGAQYQIGDTFEITLYTVDIPKQKFSFTVAGFYEDTFFSTINSTITGFILEETEYLRLEKQFNGKISGMQYSVKLKEREESEAFVTKYKEILKERLSEGLILDSNHYMFVKSSRTITSSIGAILLICFSLLIILISLVIVKFRISNSIEEEIQNIGVLKAIGYTSGQIISSFLMQFISLATSGFLLGIGGAYLILPVISNMFASQTGIVWKQTFSFSAALLSFLVIECLVIFVALFSAYKIKNMHPIIALRFGILTHNFKKNPFPLEKGQGNLIVSLAGKQFVHMTKQNLWIGIIISGLTFAAVFASGLYYNIVIEEDIFLSFVAGEIPSAQLEAPDAKSAEDLLTEVKERKEVEKAFFFHTDSMICERNYEVYGYVADDFSVLNNKNWNYEGRFPKYENEVCIGGLLAKLLEKKIGDRIILSANGKEQSYLITGFIQSSNSLGHDLCLTSEGYRQIKEDFWSPIIFIYLEESENVEKFLEDMKNSSHLISAVNSEDIIRSSMATYSMTVTVFTIMIDLITIVIIVLVLYLIIKTILIRKKRELAIQKAIGFTTWQLALQNACSFLPVIFLSVLLGNIGGYFGLNPFLSALFSEIGMLKVNFILPPILLISNFLIIIAIGFITSFLLSMQIRKITPYSLMKE